MFGCVGKMGGLPAVPGRSRSASPLQVPQPRSTRSSDYSIYRCKTTFLPSKTIANPKLLIYFRKELNGHRPGRSKLHHFEVVLAGAAFGASPARRNVLPTRARENAVVGPALGLVVYEAAREATP